VDWDRLEAEFADLPGAAGADVGPSLADRIVATARRKHATRASSAAAVAALVAGVWLGAGLFVGLHERHPASFLREGSANRAEIYAAALSGGRYPLSRPLWVRTRICAAIPRVPRFPACSGGTIPADVQRRVIALLGPRLRFAARPPAPHRTGDVPVVQFGTLMLHPTQARLGIETLCGTSCGAGETLLLRRQGGRWQAVGTVGPRWVS
jgi:hypothetical protein